MFLLDVSNKNHCHEKHRMGDQGELIINKLGVLHLTSPKATTGYTVVRKHQNCCDRTRKRGKCGRVQARLAANQDKPALTTVMLAKGRSLNNKIDLIRLMKATRGNMRDCCVYVFTETCLNGNHGSLTIQ